MLLLIKVPDCGRERELTRLAVGLRSCLLVGEFPLGSLDASNQVKCHFTVNYGASLIGEY